MAISFSRSFFLSFIIVEMSFLQKCFLFKLIENERDEEKKALCLPIQRSFQLSTLSLIDQYHQERLEEQCAMDSTPFGVLSARVYFHHDCLYVEVLRARNVIPLDNNGKIFVRTHENPADVT